MANHPMVVLLNSLSKSLQKGYYVWDPEELEKLNLPSIRAWNAYVRYQEIVAYDSVSRFHSRIHVDEGWREKIRVFIGGRVEATLFHTTANGRLETEVTDSNMALTFWAHLNTPERTVALFLNIYVGEEPAKITELTLESELLKNNAHRLELLWQFDFRTGGQIRTMLKQYHSLGAKVVLDALTELDHKLKSGLHWDLGAPLPGQEK